jgi:hypothetical protein
MIMAPFFFRSHRIEHDLTMRVGLQDTQNGITLPGLLTTTVINFSPEGACLILSNLTIDGKHLFFSTLNSDSYHLVLYLKNQDDVEDEAMITAESIWMDSCEHQEKSAFKIGIRFLHNQKTLFQQLQKRFNS